PAGQPAHSRARRLGGDRREAHGRVPVRLPRRVAAARPHHDAGVGSAGGAARRAAAGHARALRGRLVIGVGGSGAEAGRAERTAAPGGRRIEVLAAGPYATVQDLGRFGYAHLGVPRSGAADAPALRLANRLVGNPEGHAGIELTFGGARLRFPGGAWIA